MNIHVFTGALKAYIKSLPIPLFHPDFLEDILKTMSFFIFFSYFIIDNIQDNVQNSLNEIYCVCQKLDHYSLSTFKVIMKHLHKFLFCNFYNFLEYH